MKSSRLSVKCAAVSTQTTAVIIFTVGSTFSALTTRRSCRSLGRVTTLPNWGFGSINEGMRVGVISYIHMHVGRDKDAKMFDDPRFLPVNGSDGKLAHVRVKRGTRFRPGDAVGTVNRMYHVHMNVGPPSAEVNPLTLSPIGFRDNKPPTIEKNAFNCSSSQANSFLKKRMAACWSPVRYASWWTRLIAQTSTRIADGWVYTCSVIKSSTLTARRRRVLRSHVSRKSTIASRPTATRQKSRLCGRERHHRLRQRGHEVLLRSDQLGARWTR